MLEISQKLSQFIQSLTLSCSQRLKLPKNALFWNGYIKTHTHKIVLYGNSWHMSTFPPYEGFIQMASKLSFKFEILSFQNLNKLAKYK